MSRQHNLVDMNLYTTSFQDEITQEWVIVVLTEGCQLLQGIADQPLRCLQENAALKKLTGSIQGRSPWIARNIPDAVHVYEYLVSHSDLSGSQTWSQLVWPRKAVNVFLLVAQQLQTLWCRYLQVGRTLSGKAKGEVSRKQWHQTEGGRF